LADRLIIGLGGLFLFFPLLYPLPHKGLWIRGISIAAPDSLPRIIKVIEDLNITDVYVQMVVGGSSYYNSKILPRSEYLARHSNQDYSPADSLLGYCKKRNIRFHAWINALTVWSFYKKPDSLNHIFYKKPDWFLRDVFGRSMLDYSGYQWTDLGLEGLFIQPDNPFVADFLKEICLEIMEKYKLDGIHFDFFRYPGIYWGIGDSLKTSIFAGLEAENIRWLSLKRYPKLSLFNRWLVYNFYKFNKIREENLYHLARMLYQAIKKNRNILISFAVVADPAWARYQYAQNWWQWNNCYDYVISMAYTQDVGLFNDFLDFTYSRRPLTIMGIGLLWKGMEESAICERSLITQRRGRGFCYFDFASIDTMFDIGRLNCDTVICLFKDTTESATLANLFSESPPQRMVDSGKVFTKMDTDLDFFLFLASLSLNPEQDLRQLALTREKFLEYIHNDVCTFEYINNKIFTGLDNLIEPPGREIIYEFFPYEDNDTVKALEYAKTKKNLTKKLYIYPVSMAPFVSEVFSSNKGERKILHQRSGIYVFEIKRVKNGGRKMKANRVKKENLPIFRYWTIKERFDKFVKEDYGDK